MTACDSLMPTIIISREAFIGFYKTHLAEQSSVCLIEISPVRSMTSNSILDSFQLPLFYQYDVFLMSRVSL